MVSDNILMATVLAAVLSIGILGIYFTSSLTGMVTSEQMFEYNIADFVDVILTGGDGANESFTAIVTPMAVGTVVFDSFGNCTGCENYTIEYSPYDLAYAGVGANNQTLCAIVKTDSNAQADINAKLNNSLPTGFDSLEITSRSFHNVSTNGTQRFAFNNLTGSFDDANALALTTANQQLLGNWSDGTGFGGVSEDISCRWTINPYEVAAGEYTILVDYSGSLT